jgi:hypothetical protein
MISTWKVSSVLPALGGVGHAMFENIQTAK